jgi:hypothetical protein
MRHPLRHPSRLAIPLLALLLASPLAGCGGGAEANYSTAAAPPQPPPAAEAPRAKAHEMVSEEDGRLAMAGQAQAGAPGAVRPPGSVDPARAPILIYTANVTMAVFEVNASLSKVDAIGRELGGFLAKRDDQSITIRVPSAMFDEAVKRIEAVGDMLHRNVSTEDVTEEFRDLEVRLKSARAVQTRLTELLAKAAKVEDSLAIEKELDRVTGEIERIEGRMKFLRDRAAFSTITVRFQPKSTDQVGEAPFKLPVPWLDEINLPRLLHL